MFNIAVFGFAGIGAAGVYLVRSWRERPTDECRGTMWEWLTGREQCPH